MASTGTTVLGSSTTLFQALLVFFLFFASATMASDESSPPLSVYFGYGSNLWLRQMALRCPTSTFIGIGRLPKWRWIINDRGYANVVQSRNVAQPDEHDWTGEVWGMVYTLTFEDERRLDRNEGVPYSYTKEIHSIDFWPTKNSSSPNDVLREGFQPLNTTLKPEQKHMLVYVDRKRIIPDQPKTEYIHRMNMGIKDALTVGVPAEYIDAVLRKDIPPEDDGNLVGQDQQKLALKQAANFADDDHW